MKKIIAFFMLALITSCVSQDTQIKVLIVDGVNNHNWVATTKATKATLLQTGKFTVDVSTSPGKKASKEEWAKWNPDFSKYEVVVSNFNDGGKTLWSKATQKSFESFVNNGGGFVPVHAADNSSSDWLNYNKMIAVGGWGGRKAGKSGFLLRDQDGSWNKCCEKEGKSGGHGPQRDFLVKHDKPNHPIVAGLPTEWMHAKDELYHSLRGPAENVEVIASSLSKNGSKVREPMILVVKFGKGTICHLPMGHANGKSLQCVGFQTILARSTEFAARGEVTIAAPANFPGKDKAVIVEPSKLLWK
ncbi:ThuA domain-containing protein [Lentisphaera profundi]|uniref:ThuA domain-containing protein n=1 Tax=Lentisphaera profundi TaxID=1658616 RepID=A0ABY7VV36_9BACT|nr:ThuA domain-containing protein [Lentisphaera profundi]WDE97154.1 ThuA domain-containing protein [Lentisphaera profundi]